MCGILGKWASSPLDPKDLDESLKTINHRGPDDKGTWLSENKHIGFGSVRLAVQDLTSAGHQPMHSKSGRFVIVFNGEIYNHIHLRNKLNRSELEWNGQSDTETLIEYISTFGIEKTLTDINGMFAFAVWDKVGEILTFARDRFGEKPIYYGFIDGSLIFGSELKALKKLTSRRFEISRESVALFLKHNHVPAPHTIYTSIYKLPPASFLTITSEVIRNQKSALSVAYWAPEKIARLKLQSLQTFQSDEEAIIQLEKKLSDSVVDQLISNVPLGTFLSGGIDSSIVTSIAQKHSGRPINTFSIGFLEKNHDESRHAEKVAKYLGTNHSCLYLTEKEALNVIQILPQIYDEPFADSSQIPTVLLSRFAKEKVTVCLTGDGGDELFFGYDRYSITSQFWSRIQWMPANLRQVAFKCLKRLNSKMLSQILQLINQKSFATEDHIKKGIQLLECKDSRELYCLIMSYGNPNEIMATKIPQTSNNFESIGDFSFEHQMQIWDTKHYLPDDILTKVDRASMSASLETRSPFLDHRVFEFAWGLPEKYKYRENTRKWILRQLLFIHVPQELVDRPKKGFAVPMDQWLRGSFLEWAENLLSHKKLSSGGYFNAEKIEELWKQHKNGTHNWQYILWNILMFQAWLEFEQE